MSDLRTRQQRAFATAAILLALPVPETSPWGVYDGVLDGMLWVVPSGNLDAARLGMHQWAAVLADPVWTLEPHRGSQHKLGVVGTCMGQRVEIWALVEGAEGVDVGELSAPPDTDAPAEQPEGGAL